MDPEWKFWMNAICLYLLNTHLIRFSRIKAT
jgi:hypothetical protein